MHTLASDGCFYNDAAFTGCHSRDPERTGQPRAKIKNHL
jgi:hypothetical protein